MQDTEDLTDAANEWEKSSRRERLKDVLSKTKSKWKKEKVPEPREEFKLSDDVNEFLAAGRKAAAMATIRSVEDVPRQDNRPPQPSTPESVSGGQLSPRGTQVPRLDVSQFNRWPNARPVATESHSPRDNHLTPTYNDRRFAERSHSFNSALAKKRLQSRGLSVTFVNSPPTVIGEGGDRAQAPTFEISRARQRSRSLSPYLNRPASTQSSASNSPNSRSPVRRKPVPPPVTAVQSGEQEDDIFQPRPVRRVQTGFNGQEVPSPRVDKSFEMQLQRALKFDDESVLNKPLTDPRLRQQVDPQPVTRPKQPHAIQTAIGGNQFIANQSPLVTSAHNPHHPDLQQSVETSKRSPPEKMPNFYAAINRQSQSLEPQSPSQPLQSQSMAMKPHLQQSPVLQERQGQRSVGLPDDRVQQTQVFPSQPPRGWI